MRHIHARISNLISENKKLRFYKVLRHPLTLVELLLVLAILGIAVGWIGMNAAKALRNQRFQTEVSEVVDLIRLAQNLSLSFHQSAIVRFTTSGEHGIEQKLIFDTPMPGNWNGVLSKKGKLFKHIHGMTFPDALRLPHEDPHAIEVKFLSGGSRISKGIITLSTSSTHRASGAIERFIVLSGYPGPIQSYATLEEAKRQLEQDKTLDEALTLHTVEEIQQYRNQLSSQQAGHE